MYFMAFIHFFQYFQYKHKQNARFYFIIIDGEPYILNYFYFAIKPQ